MLQINTGHFQQAYSSPRYPLFAPQIRHLLTSCALTNFIYRYLLLYTRISLRAEARPTEAFSVYIRGCVRCDFPWISTVRRPEEAN